MKIELIFITYNRLDYTKLALPALLADPTEEFSLTIWDNASTDSTVEYLQKEAHDPRIVDVIFSKENLGLRGAVNYLFDKSSADLVGIVPNDFIVTPGWTREIAEAHAEIPKLGMIGCWHLLPEEFNYEKAKHKIQQFGKHSILRHPWTGGNGLVKLRTVKEMGPLESNGTCGYLIRMALKGYVNGFYFPLIYVEHMDDPWSKHYAFSDKYQEAFEMGATASELGIRTVKEAKACHKIVVGNILDDPWDVKYYVGWRKKLRRARAKINRILKNSPF